jgi:hypothetical protein
MEFGQLDTLPDEPPQEGTFARILRRVEFPPQQPEAPAFVRSHGAAPSNSRPVNVSSICCAISPGHVIPRRLHVQQMR